MNQYPENASSSGWSDASVSSDGDARFESDELCCNDSSEETLNTRYDLEFTAPIVRPGVRVCARGVSEKYLANVYSRTLEALR